MFDKDRVKEILGIGKAAGKQSPKSTARYLRFVAFEAEYRSLGMLFLRFPNCRLNPHPVTNQINLAERNACLRHAPRAWIHPHKNHPFLSISESLKILPVPFPGIFQGIVHVGHGLRETQARNGIGKPVRRVQEGRWELHNGVLGDPVFSVKTIPNKFGPPSLILCFRGWLSNMRIEFGESDRTS